MDERGEKSPDYAAVSDISETYRRWCLERTLIRGCSGSYDANVEKDTKNGEGYDNTCNGGVDRPYVSRQATGEEKEGNLEHDGETVDEQTERPLLEAIEFALAITAAFGHGSSRVSEVPAQPLLAQHCDKCSQ